MELFNLAERVFDVWPPVLLHDTVRYFIFVLPAFLIVWIWKGKAWEHRRIQPRPANSDRKSQRESRQLWFEIRYSLSTIVIFSLFGTSIILARQAGYTAIYEDPAEYGLFYLLASPIFLILLHDAYFYWSHRFMHWKPVFRLAHAVHHRSTSPSPWAAYSFHPLEALIQAAFYPLVLFALPVHPSMMLAFIFYMMIRNVWGHLGFELLPPGFLNNRWLNWNNATTHHELHHATSRHNFGLYFTWWDRWMNTEHPRYAETFQEVTARRSRNEHAATATAKKPEPEINQLIRAIPN